MRILTVIETDLLKKGPQQHHHLMERLSTRNHKIRIIDFEILWRKKVRDGLSSKKLFVINFSKAIKNSRVTIIRPRILYIPILDYVSEAFTYGKEIYRQIKQFKPDVIVGFSALNTYIALKLAKRYKIPFVYYLIDAQHTLIPFKAFQPIGKILESQIAKKADEVIVINEELKRYAINLGANPKKVRIIRAGIDPNKFNPNIDGQEIRERYDLDEKDTVLFFMGWLYPFSGLKEVATELAKIKDNYPDIKLLIVGEGELYPELEQIKKAHNLNQLTLVKWQPYTEIPKYIAASDLCLLPAHNNEVMKAIVPIKMYEYMACGKPVITTKLPGIVKEFGVGNGVIYVDNPENVIEMAVKLSRNKEKLKEIGLKAAKYVKKYNWENITNQFESILNSLKNK